MRSRALTNRGGTLLSVLVAVGIFGVVLAAVSNMLQVNTESFAIALDRSEREDLRRWLGSATNCGLTRAAAGGACPATPVRKAVKRDSSAGPVDIVAGSGAYTKIGDYELQMLCSGNVPMTLNFQARRVKGTTGPWQSLFMKVPFQC